MSNLQDKTTTLGKRYGALVRQKKKLNEQLGEINKEIMKISMEDLPKLMEDSELDSFKIKGVGTIYLANELYLNVKTEMRSQLYTWLRKKGHGDLVVEYVWPRTLQAWAREQLRNGQPLPDKMMTAAFMPTARIRSSNGKAAEE